MTQNVTVSDQAAVQLRRCLVSWPTWSPSAQQGDRAAFDELVRATYADTYTLAYRLTGDEEDARDVVQEAYLGRSGGSSGSGATPSSRRGCTGSRPTARPPTSAAAPATATTELDRRRAARRRSTRGRPADLCRCRSPPRARSRTRSPSCRPGCGRSSCCETCTTWPTRDIAAELGISESAAKVRLHRARRKLRERLFPLPGEATDGPDEARAHAV